MVKTFAKLFLFTLLLTVLTGSPVFARWASKEEATYKVNFERREVHVRKDASATTVVERQIEILKDQARVDQGLMRLYYDATTSKFRVLKAYTVNGDKQTPVAGKDIETKPLASTGPGFNVISQVTVAFPNVQVGSKLYIETEEIESRARVPNYFNFHTHLYGEWFEDYRMRVKSEIPLHAQKFDSGNDLKLKAEGDTIEISLRHEYYRTAMDETAGIPDVKTFAWFAVSSLKDLSKFPTFTLQAYEVDISAPLPAKFKAMVEVARTQKTDVDQINAVTSQLADAVRYVGDWRALEGIFHPRGHETVIQTGFGDCKDYSVSTAAMLRSLGFDANVAWIGRGVNWITSPLAETSLAINHAIVYARKDGRDYWIDPTNVTSFAQGIYPDIADRTAVVLYPEKLEVKRTPKLNAQTGTIRIRNEIRYTGKAKLEAKGSMEFLGSAARPWTAFELSGNKANRDYQMIGYITPVDTVSKMKFEAPDLRQRTVADFKANFVYDQPVRAVTTTAGEGHFMPRSFLVGLFMIRKEDRVTDVQMNDPVMLEIETRISGRKIRFDRPIRCEGQSPWADYSREFVKTGSSYVLKDRYTLKVPILLADDVRTEEFARFQAKLLSCLSDSVVVFR